MSSNVKVAVRVRPFNARENKLSEAGKGGLCIEMSGDGKRTTIFDHDNPSERKDFHFDYCYWSHDNSQRRHTQDDLFSDLGGFYLDAAFEGYNSSLFAYGQTGAGKSYSMYQKGAPPGLIPRGAVKLFEKIAENKAADPSYDAKVEVTYLELYMERVRDLLDSRTDPRKPDAKSLKVRGPRPDGSFFVPAARTLPVQSYQDIEDLLEQGLNRRIIAATAMNPTSSRSHSIFSINLTQTSNSIGALSAIINLIDLAGSESSKQTGATGATLQEGIKINLSLGTLKAVIKKLAAGKKKQVPYRGSVLTQLLKQSLGGNSRTIMVAALSPHSNNYSMTLSTLNYAKMANEVKNADNKNQSSKDALERELREEIEALRKQLEENKKNGGHGGGGASDAALQALKEQLQYHEASLARYEMTPEEVQKLNADHKARWEQLRAASSDGGYSLEELSHAFDIKITPDTPRLVNISPDPALSGQFLYPLRPGVNRIGLSGAENEQTICLIAANDGSIKLEHCIMVWNENTHEILLSSANIEDETLGISVNGVRSGEVVVRHNDRILLGTGHRFQLLHPPSARDEDEVDGAVSCDGNALVDFSSFEKERKMLQDLQSEHEILSTQHAAAVAQKEAYERQSDEAKLALRQALAEKKRLENKAARFEQELKEEEEHDRKQKAALDAATKRVEELTSAMFNHERDQKMEKAEVMIALQNQLAEQEERHAAEIRQLKNELRRRLEQEQSNDMKALIAQNELKLAQKQREAKEKKSNTQLISQAAQNWEFVGLDLGDDTATTDISHIEDLADLGVQDTGLAEVLGAMVAQAEQQLAQEETKEQRLARIRAEVRAKREAKNANSSSSSSSSTTTTTTTTTVNGQVVEHKTVSSSTGSHVCLFLEVKLALNLPPTDGATQVNPRCMILLFDQEGDKIASFKTRTCMDTSSPNWQEIFSLTNAASTLLKVEVRVMSQVDNTTSPVIGTANLFASAITDGNCVHRLNLQKGGVDVPRAKLILVTKKFIGEHATNNPLFNPQSLIRENPHNLAKMFKRVDTDGDGKLTKKELMLFARMFYEQHSADFASQMDMDKAEVDRILLKGRPLAEHMRELVRAASDAIDDDRDGYVVQREFITGFHKFAEGYFSQPSSCSVM